MPGGAHVQQVIIVSKSPESPPDPPVDGADLQVLVLLRDLTDGLTSGLGPVDVANLLLEGCLRHTACHHAGIMLADPAGRLHVLASSSEDARNSSCSSCRPTRVRASTPTGSVAACRRAT